MYFRHPHLVRGIVHTPYGAFTINRGLADVPEEIGESLGWLRMEEPQTRGASTGNRATDDRPSANSGAASG